MRWLRRTLLLGAAVLAAVTPLLAVSEPTPDELEWNRQRLAKWRSDPKNYARLRQDLADFLKLSGAKQEQIRRLDHDLAEKDLSTQARLLDVMERYADWLDRLPAADREQVLGAPDRRERTRVIREIRERQWLERLPQAVRARIQQAPAEEHAKLIKRERNRQRNRRQEWAEAQRNWDDVMQRRPRRLQDLPPYHQMFVREILMPRLDDAEKERLERVKNNPALFGKVLVELADKHPPALPGEQGPRRFAELPRNVQQRLAPFRNPQRNPRKFPKLPELRDRLAKAEGQWPAYGTAVAALARHCQIRLPPEMFPAGPADLSFPVQQFLKQRLRPTLTDEERLRLRATVGKWPNYPLALAELAKKHNLRVPWLTLPPLPPPGERWDVYRGKRRPGQADFPPVSRHTLRLFALVELSAKERADLGLTSFDRTSWPRLRKEYFKRKPHELKKRRPGGHKDERKKGGK
jgi:hypothetical protein